MNLIKVDVASVQHFSALFHWLLSRQETFAIESFGEDRSPLSSLGFIRIHSGNDGFILSKERKEKKATNDF